MSIIASLTRRSNRPASTSWFIFLAPLARAADRGSLSYKGYNHQAITLNRLCLKLQRAIAQAMGIAETAGQTNPVKIF